MNSARSLCKASSINAENLKQSCWIDLSQQYQATIHQAKIYHSHMKHCLRNRWIMSVNDQFMIRVLVQETMKTQLWLKTKKILQRLIWSLSLLVWTSEKNESNNLWTKHLYFIVQHDVSEISMCHSTHLLLRSCLDHSIKETRSWYVCIVL